ncbi:hypothetical protein B1A99_19010 [Cohnella sp. CIP 111063]|uniref:RICIN domain-containing protein n=1 Tax=unclassified Cohnella TaxID=2636738 RepID=UPI000B8C60CA|nr:MULTISPECIES: RICIN domain-containing protein [unclassified Cohnella]OXS56946.1 hypothetical protein B1A99_19010 [Cohnella sp. CIP 111063]PRX69792.1 ricin-type beta-trefoil lectin protein [Cohnella sp. SGD-V74]
MTTVRKKLVAIIVLCSTVLFGIGVPANEFGGAAPTASASGTCTPYGPWEGFQYDPSLLMKKMGEPSDQEPIAGPYLSAHRGAWGTDPDLPQAAAENSITAIDNAAALKFEMVELDVHLASDKKLVLMHDYTMGRTTNYPYTDGSHANHWDVFNQLTPDGTGPVTSGTPPVLTNWSAIQPYNNLISQLTSTQITQTYMRLFDKSLGIQGSISYGGVSVYAKGSWSVTNETVPTLKQALEHIGDNYPGMTVVLDLRHADEVAEAMNVIDQVQDCQGRPARDWVILKPFVNVFPRGFESALYQYGYRVYQYNWIPVVSFRLVPPNPQGGPSVIPDSPGPDISQIPYDALTYLRDYWPMEKFPTIVTYENGYNGSGTGNLKPAYDWADGLVKNMKSWRPPDIDVQHSVVNPANGKTIIGFNWKDDGMGAYPVYKEDSQGYEKVRENASVITVDDAAYVLKMEIATRDAAQMSISKQIDTTKAKTEMQYKLVDFNSKRTLNLEDNYSGSGNKLEILKDNNGLAQTWGLKQVPGIPSNYYIVHRDSGKVLEMVTGSNKVQLNSYKFNSGVASPYLNQHWKLKYNDSGTYNGTYTLVNASNDYALNVEWGATADGTKVIAWQETPSAPNEKWHLVPVTTFTLQDQNSKKLISVVSNSTAENATVAIWDNSNASGQEWRFVNRGDGTYAVVNPHSQKVLTVKGGVPLPRGTPINIYSDLSQNNQRWRLLYNKEDNTYTLDNPFDKKVLNIQGAYSSNGAIAITWDTQSNFYKNERLKIGLWGASQFSAQIDVGQGVTDYAMAVNDYYDTVILEKTTNGKNEYWLTKTRNLFDVVQNQEKVAWELYYPDSGKFLGSNYYAYPNLVPESSAYFFYPTPYGVEDRYLLKIHPNQGMSYILGGTGPFSPLLRYSDYQSSNIPWFIRPSFYAVH